MKDLSKTSVEEAITRYCLSLFRNALKQSADIGKALEYCNEKSKTENSVYAEFARKYPALPKNGLKERAGIIELLWQDIIKRAEKEGRKILKEEMIRNIGVEVVRSRFHGTGLKFSINKNAEFLLLRIMFPPFQNIHFRLDYKKLHNPGVLQDISEGAIGLSKIFEKYGNLIKANPRYFSDPWEL